ncbi:MAG: UDP-glucose 4-epimerase GalE [candidate division WOR-3 bacterium]|nr:UDP-glucose 4-epimerase GalE [candidate division WOR-3 bacterium]
MKQKHCKLVLVTGGAGYIGSVTSKLLLENNYRVVVIDNLSSGKITAIPQGAKFIKGDVGDINLLRKVFTKYKFDCVMHFASLISIADSIKNPEKYFKNNVVAGMNLLQEMVATGSCRRFVFSSSAAVYGAPKAIPINEETPSNPLNPYGQSKKIFELFLKEYTNSRIIDCIVLRFFNAAGAYITEDGIWGEDHRPETHLIPLLLKTALKQTKIIINGNDYPTPDGTCIRDYIHVYDVAKAHILAMDNMARGFAVYNVGTGIGYSNLEVLQMAQQVIGQKINYKIGKRRVGDCPILIADVEKIKKELRFKPEKSDLKTIIQDAWLFCQNQLKKYK